MGFSGFSDEPIMAEVLTLDSMLLKKLLLYVVAHHFESNAPIKAYNLGVSI